MLILSDMPGQLGNRFWSMAPYVAFCLRERRRLLVPFFGSHARPYSHLNSLPGIIFVRLRGPVYLWIARRLLGGLRRLPRSLRLMLRLHLDNDSWGRETWREDVLRSPRSVVFLAGWNHPAPIEDLTPYRPLLRKIFEPAQRYRRRPEQLISGLRQHCDHLLAVHLRQGDYKDFIGGRYFYPPSVYERVIDELAAQLKGKAAFVLCTDSVETIGAFTGHEVVRLPDAGPVEDLYLLSLCDFIVGPPSTFSMWASFYGATPIQFIEAPDQRIDLGRFSPIIGLDRFADGRSFRLAPADQQAATVYNTAQ